MKDAALVIIKPDGISKRLVGNIITKFYLTGCDIVALKTAKATKRLAEEHYRHIKGTRFFNSTVKYFKGDFHKTNTLIVMIYSGRNAITKCREIAGATNPEDAEPDSIRGSYGRIIIRDGMEIYENVVHVSSDHAEAEREIKLWFDPDDITVDLFPTKHVMSKSKKVRTWK